jgi:hypothetical protein
VVAVDSDADGDSRAPASGGGGVRAAGDNTLEASDDEVPALVAAILAVGARDLCLPSRCSSFRGCGPPRRIHYRYKPTTSY